MNRRVKTGVTLTERTTRETRTFVRGSNRNVYLNGVWYFYRRVEGKMYSVGWKEYPDGTAEEAYCERYEGVL